MGLPTNHHYMTDHERKLFVKFAKKRIDELEREVATLATEKNRLEREVKEANRIIEQHIYPTIDESECDHYNL